MSVGSWLRQLDDLVVPDRERAKYDSPRPHWYMYGSVVGSISGIVFALALFQSVGPARAVICSTAAVAVVGWLLAARTWQRKHRVQSANL